MSEELKPCPFCGGQAEISQVGTTGWKLTCSKCPLINYSQKAQHFHLDWLKAKMIERWNTRGV